MCVCVWRYLSRPFPISISISIKFLPSFTICSSLPQFPDATLVINKSKKAPTTTTTKARQTTTREATTRHWQLANNCIHHHQQEQQISVEFLSVGMRIGYKGGQRRVVALGGRWGATATATVANVRVIHQFSVRAKSNSKRTSETPPPMSKNLIFGFLCARIKMGITISKCLLMIYSDPKTAAAPQPQAQSESRRAATTTTIAATKRLWVRLRMGLPPMRVRVNVNTRRV